MGKHGNNSQRFKEKNYKAKFLISSILKKKIDRDNFRKKKQNKHQKKGKNHVGNIVAIHSVGDESYSASPHDLALFVMTCNCNSQTTQY